MGFYNFPFKMSMNSSKTFALLVIFITHYETFSNSEVNKLNILDKVVHRYLQIDYKFLLQKLKTTGITSDF